MCLAVGFTVVISATFCCAQIPPTHGAPNGTPPANVGPQDGKIAEAQPQDGDANATTALVQQKPAVSPAVNGANESDEPTGKPASQFDADAAFGYLKDICDLGPRVSTSPGMQKQQKYLEAHFKKIGGTLYNQPFNARSPYTQKLVQLHNIIVQFHPERKKRLLICCHHDTRPFADSDPQSPRAKFIGANDGGSGVALLCELGKHLSDMEGSHGVDLIFFDGEEFVIQRQRDPMFLGSTHFANEYAAGNVGWKYEYAILVDMVADKDLQIYFEANSLGYADGLTRSIWSVANQLGVKEFVAEKRHEIRDDHLPLNSIARIQTCDIIDFDFPNPQVGNIYWHTRKDTIENCSAESLGKVGSVVLEWIRQVQKLNQEK